MLGAEHIGIVWRTSWQTCLCSWARHLTGCLRLYMADRWHIRTSPGYNCEVANPACRKRQLLETKRDVEDISVEEVRTGLKMMKKKRLIDLITYQWKHGSL